MVIILKFSQWKNKAKKKVIDELNAIVGKIGEKIEISRFAIDNTTNGEIVDYVHSGSKLGVLIEAENVPSDKTNVFSPVLKDIAMQVAAMAPVAVDKKDVWSESAGRIVNSGFLNNLEVPIAKVQIIR